MVRGEKNIELRTRKMVVNLLRQKIESRGGGEEVEEDEEVMEEGGEEVENVPDKAKEIV
mgnify:CR=1 FL=1